MILQGKQIFVVEDNVQNRIIFQMILAGSGASVEFERWGKDTLRQLQYSKNVDLIVLDLMLHGGVSGYDIFTELRKEPEYASIPIVAVSASEPSFAIPQTRKMGFNGFIGKPINKQLFPTQLAKILDGEQVWHAVNGYTQFAS